MARTYTDADRISALAALEVNAGNVTRTARDLGIPKPTLISWRNLAVSAGSAVPDRVKTDWADAFGKAALLGAQIIETNLRRYLTVELKPSELQSVAITTGIAVDKHLDYRDGRKGSEVNVNASASAGVIIQRNTPGLSGG